MSDPAALRARIEALETQIAHQDRAIEDLNAVVTAQWQEIDRLSRQVAALADHVRQTAATAPPGNERPPHY
jgi:SlyX protein